MKLGEWLLIMGTLLIIGAVVCVHPVAGVLVAGVACLVWGYLLLKAEAIKDYHERG